jgi:hypothetical protein
MWHFVLPRPFPHGPACSRRGYFSRSLGAIAMPFTGRAIDPNDLELMRAIFNKVCERLGLQCRREDRITDVVVDAIIKFAATGERDPDRVCELLVHLRESHGGHEPAISAPPVQPH